MKQMRSFYFGQIYLANYNLFLATRHIPALPRTREKTMDIAGRDGKLDLGAEFAERPLPLPCVLRCSSVDEFYWSVRAIANLFNPKKGSQKLVSEEEPDKYIMARYAGQLDIAEVLKWGEFELPLVAYDPYYYSNVQDTEVFNVTNSGQSLTIVKDVFSLEEYPVIRIINSGTTPVTNIKLTRVNTP